VSLGLCLFSASPQWTDCRKKTLSPPRRGERREIHRKSYLCATAVQNRTRSAVSYGDVLVLVTTGVAVMVAVAVGVDVLVGVGVIVGVGVAG